jgi:transposase-like protein
MLFRGWLRNRGHAVLDPARWSRAAMFFAFPLDDLLDEERCYRWLMERRWPGGKPVCPRCGETERLHVHNRERAPVEDFRCKACRRIFNVHTGTIFQHTHRSCRHIILILQGFMQGKSTNLLSRELGCEYDTLLALRHRWQAACAEQNLREPGFDKQAVVELDEMYQNSGEKRYPAPRPGRSAAAAGEQGAGPWDV